MVHASPSAVAALLYRPEQVSEAALSRGFAVALAGWDVPRPRLALARLAGTPFWVAFYTSGVATEDEALEHAIELFEDELSPAVGVIDAAIEEGSAAPVVLTLVYAEDVLHDDAWRVTASAYERRFVREGEDGMERGVETQEGGETTELVLAAEDDARFEEALRPHRGSTFLSELLGVPARAALMGALYQADRALPVRLVDPSDASIEAEVRRLNRALGRVDGRGSLVAPPSLASVAQPSAHAAFCRVYDFADPRDPADLYRELAIGAVAGTLRFLRMDDITALEAEAGTLAAREALYPFARLAGSALGAKAESWLGLRKDGIGVALVRAGRVAEAGPTFGELLCYLALGWSRRTEAEEDLIGALMLRAKLRASPRD